MYYKDFFKLLSDHNLKAGHPIHEWFDWLLDDCLATFGRKIPKHNWPPEDAREGIFTLSEAYADTVANEPAFTDLLGRAYMDIASHWSRKGMGQYFTPQPIAELMVGLTQEEIPKDRLTTILDPCVGSGVMTLASIQKVMKQQPDRVECFSVTGVDLDYTCARMFPLQVLANGLIHKIEVGQLVAFHGNALDNPNEWQTIIEGVHRRWHGLPATPSIEAIKKMTVSKITEKPQQNPIGEQMGLF